MTNNIKLERVRRGLSQEELASKAFISRATLSRIETGTSVPDVDMKKRWSEILEVPEYHLFNETAETESTDAAANNQELSHKISILISLVLMVLSFFALPYGIFGAAANVVYCFKSKLGKWITTAAVLIFVFTFYAFVGWFFPGIMIGWTSAS